MITGEREEFPIVADAIPLLLCGLLVRSRVVHESQESIKQTHSTNKHAHLSCSRSLTTGVTLHVDQHESTRETQWIVSLLGLIV